MTINHSNLRTNPTSRSDFVETWLVESTLNEMPMGISSFNTFQHIEYIIKERIDIGTPIVKISENYFKMVGYKILYYWYGDETNVILGAELQIKPQGLVINLVGKNPNYKGRMPFASNLYDVIVKDSNESIRLLSDDKISDEGYAIWKKLFNLGHKISVYDIKDPGKTFQYFKNINDMDQYFKNNDEAYRRYQFILNESVITFGDTISFFRLRRFRETAGLDLED